MARTLKIGVLIRGGSPSMTDSQRSTLCLRFWWLGFKRHRCCRRSPVGGMTGVAEAEWCDFVVGRERVERSPVL